MKPQQLFADTLAETADLWHAVEARARCARTNLPTLAAVAVAIASSVVLTLGGCASSAGSAGIAPVAQPLAPAAVGLEATSNAAATATPALASDWWRAVGDPMLDGLIERALAGSPNLKVAQARLARAQAAIDGAEANGGARVDARVDVTRQRFSANGIHPPPLGGGIVTLGHAQVGTS